jgi:hypothetical protein
LDLSNQAGVVGENRHDALKIQVSVADLKPRAPIGPNFPGGGQPHAAVSSVKQYSNT